jgi:hypothetical protein
MIKTDEKTHLSKTVLKERGWTDAAIKKFLGGHDLEVKNPKFRSAAPCKLYEITRVEASESSDDWRDWYSKSLARRAKQSEISKAIAEKKRTELIDEMTAMIEIADWIPTSAAKLKSMAIRHYNQHQAEFEASRNKFDSPGNRADGSESADFLQRITMNWLRHEASNYEYVLSFLSGQIGRSEAYESVRFAVEAKILEVAPAIRDIGKDDET